MSREILGVHFTAREMEIWRRAASGEPNKAIAAALGISLSTVGKHRGNLQFKLGVTHTVALVHAAVRYGVITIERHQP